MFSTFKTAMFYLLTKPKCFHDSIFYLLILAITCLLCYLIRRKVNAWFVNMVFSDKHKTLTKNLYQLKRYNVRQLRTEFPNKDLTPSSINRLLKKFRDMGTVHDRRQGRDRPRSARENENSDQVKVMVLSREDQPKLTAQSVKYHGRQAFLSHLLSAVYERICS